MTKQKTSGYNAARKKALVGADRNKLDYITNWLKTNHTGVQVSNSNCHIQIDDEKGIFHHKRESDLVLNQRVHVQHDTVKVHCELGFESTPNDRSDKDKKRNKTAKRNSEYWDKWMKTGTPFIVINQDLARMLDLNEGALTAYLYYHALMLENARNHA